MIEIALYQRLGEFTLDASFESDAQVTALSGSSGAGKTTILNSIAGLIRSERGKIVVSGRVLVDTEKGVYVPRHKRRIGYVFQDARLFPHLSVERNLKYGRWLSGSTAPLEPVVELLGIGHLLKRSPRLLSGGEAQRVAIGRALLADPALLLLDEPLSALDQPRREEILPFLEALPKKTGVPILYVSHARDEIARLAGKIVWLENGRVVGEDVTGK